MLTLLLATIAVAFHACLGRLISRTVFIPWRDHRRFRRWCDAMIRDGRTF